MPEERSWKKWRSNGVSSFRPALFFLIPTRTRVSPFVWLTSQLYTIKKCGAITLLQNTWEIRVLPSMDVGRRMTRYIYIFRTNEGTIVLLQNAR